MFSFLLGLIEKIPILGSIIKFICTQSHKNPKKVNTYLWISLSIAVVTILGMAFYIDHLSNANNFVIVPDVTLKTFDRAKNELYDAGLLISGDADNSAVVNCQNPRGGILVKPRTTVDLTFNNIIESNSNTRPETIPKTTQSDVTIEAEPSVFSFTKEDVQEGKKIKLGKYEQDGNELTAPEDIEWWVIKLEDDQALLISVMALEEFQYHTSNASTGWDLCSLRNKLNQQFFNNAFSTEEKCIICSRENVQHKHPSYPNWDQGHPSSDNVFLLSAAEFRNYMSNVYEVGEDIISCYPTEYVKNKHFSNSSTPLSDWLWLRTSANNKEEACRVSNLGYLNMQPKKITESGLVRPAIWIDLTKIP